MARILIAEDDTSMRHFLAMALQRAGHEVETCADGREALEALESDQPYDLLVTDIIMPGLDGIELSDRAAALRPKLKVMFITGFAAVAKDQRAAALSGPHVLSKPFHLKDLVDRVETLLAV